MLEKMIGEVFTSVIHNDDCVRFEKADGSYYQLYHYQDCCESVNIEQIIGDLNNLVGSPITVATSYGADLPQELQSQYHDSYTYEIFEFATAKGNVKIACFGSSNGYYSETFDLEYFDVNGKRNRHY